MELSPDFKVIAEGLSVIYELSAVDFVRYKLSAVDLVIYPKLFTFSTVASSPATFGNVKVNSEVAVVELAIYCL
jgi:hypothetical protein